MRARLLLPLAIVFCCITAGRFITVSKSTVDEHPSATREDDGDSTDSDDYWNDFPSTTDEFEDRLVLTTLDITTTESAAEAHRDILVLHKKPQEGDHNGSSNLHTESDTEEHHGSHGVQVWKWKFEYVKVPLVLCLFIVLIGVFKIVYHHTPYVSTYIPESCCLIILGLLMGLLIMLIWGDTHETIKFLEYDARTFFLYLLPPIILEAAYSLRDKAFIENLGTIILYAVVGTILNIAIIGGALWALSELGLMFGFHVKPLDCLIFASLIAAVDPVAVLAIFQEVGVNKMLYFMVFGESLLNDAVTVVVYNLMIEFKELPTIAPVDIFLGFVAFLCVSFGGMTIGFVCGMISAFITKYTSHVRVVEPVVLFGMAYLSYVLSEMFHFSGIIGIICCGLNQAQFACVNISPKSFISVNYFAKVASGVSESLIFIILGVMLVNDDAGFWKEWHPLFSVYSVVLCVVARVAVVFFLTYIVNYFTGGVRFISFQEQLIMAYGGLRGAVSFSLAFMLSNQLVTTKNTMLSATYIVIIFTVFIQGCTIKPMVKWLEIRLAQKEANFKLFMEFNRGMVEHMMQGIEDICGTKRGTTWLQISKYLSQRFLRPFLHKNYVRAEKSNKLIQLDHEERMRERLKSVPSNPSIHRQNTLTEMAENGEVSLTIMDEEELMSGTKSHHHEKTHHEKDIKNLDLTAVRALVKNPLQNFYHDRDLTEDDTKKMNQIHHLMKIHREARLRDMDKKKQSLFSRKKKDKNTKQELVFAALGGIGLSANAAQNSRQNTADHSRSAPDERVAFAVEGVVPEESEDEVAQELISADRESPV